MVKTAALNPPRTAYYDKEGTDVATLTASMTAIPPARQPVEENVVTAATVNSSTITVTMVEPLAGFDADLEFTLSPIDEAGMLQSLRSLRDSELRFVLSPAEVFFAAYRDALAPIITPPVADALGIDIEAAELRMFVLLTVGTSLTDTTANLRAPLVVDQRTGRAIQVILDDESLSLRHPLPAE